MARSTGSAPSKMIFVDPLNDGGEIGFYYRYPTSAEIIKHQASIAGQPGDVIFQKNLEAARSIIVGVVDGSFVNQDNRPISSDPKSEYYEESWRDVCVESDVAIPELIALGGRVFLGQVMLTNNSRRKR
jgi:hypothetical protein